MVLAFRLFKREREREREKEQEEEMRGREGEKERQGEKEERWEREKGRLVNRSDACSAKPEIRRHLVLYTVL